MKMIRRRYQFYGRVQGVGFRYTAIRAANAFGVSGWVKNERDGSVTVEAQGDDIALSRMLENIRNGSYIVIDRMEVSELPLIENDKGFDVRF